MAAYLPCRVPYIAAPFLQVIVVYRLKPSCKLVRSLSCCGRSSEAVGYVRLDKLRKVLVKTQIGVYFKYLRFVVPERALGTACHVSKCLCCLVLCLPDPYELSLLAEIFRVDLLRAVLKKG